jgi:ribonucleoside-diphosphate reductase beta chain
MLENILHLSTRFNASLEMIGGEKIFEIDQELVKQLQWFDEEIHAEVNTDFFNKKPVSYSKKTKSITENDLF